MKKIILLITLGLFTLSSSSQEIVNVILVGNNGITENIKEATSFIVIKQFPYGFQRLDYNLGAPLKKVRNYADSNLAVLNGAYYEYSFNGALTLSGIYLDNKKDKDWFYYNDTGKAILQEKYEMGVLKSTIKLDTVKEKLTTLNLKNGDREAVYKKTDNDWREYVMRNLDPEVAEKSVKGGTVRVGFTVNTSGKCVDIYLRRSVEFVLDEEAIRIIEKSPTWAPAIQDGKKVNAFRIQPISFIVE